jgi:menaquinone-dependent protoporphyrinogen oxidase
MPKQSIGLIRRKGVNVMKVLVAVASRHESTREIAAAIAEELQAAGFDVDQRNVEQAGELDDYGAVVLGSAVYVGNWLPEARRFVERHRAHLAEMPVWLFSSGPIGADDPKPHGDPPVVAELMQVTHAREHRSFTGRLDPHSLGLCERLAVKVVHAPAGDFRHWDAIRVWARSIAEVLDSSAIPTRGRS